MLERYDESELLDLIEGDLDAPSASALQKRLTGDAQARTRVGAMMRDRVALRAIGEPVLPHDFIPQIEPMLARPMLMEPVTSVSRIRPGEFRRQHRRQTRPMRWTRLAIAAVLMLALFGGSWALIDGLVHRGGEFESNDLKMAERPAAAQHGESFGAGIGLSGAVGGETDHVLGPGVVHHDRPRIAEALSPVIVAHHPSPSESDGGIFQPTEVIAAEFVLVVEAKDVAALERAVSHAVAGLGERGALVRNFSFDEAQRLSAEYRVAHGGATPVVEAPMIASLSDTTGMRAPSMSRGELYRLAQHVREQLRTRAASAQSPSTPQPVAARDATLAGDAKLAPTLEQQLDFSSRGAAYTIAVPAAELSAFIERLALDQPQPMLLRPLASLPAMDVLSAERAASSPGQSKADSAIAPTLAWFTEAPTLRQAKTQVTQARENTLVLVPVLIK